MLIRPEQETVAYDQQLHSYLSREFPAWPGLPGPVSPGTPQAGAAANSLPTANSLYSQSLVVKAMRRHLSLRLQAGGIRLKQLRPHLWVLAVAATTDWAMLQLLMTSNDTWRPLPSMTRTCLVLCLHSHSNPTASPLQKQYVRHKIVALIRHPPHTHSSHND
jgi:hypothetical protein